MDRIHRCENCQDNPDGTLLRPVPGSPWSRPNQLHRHSRLQTVRTDRGPPAQDLPKQGLRAEVEIVRKNSQQSHLDAAQVDCAAAVLVFPLAA